MIEIENKIKSLSRTDLSKLQKLIEEEFKKRRLSPLEHPEADAEILDQLEKHGLSAASRLYLKRNPTVPKTVVTTVIKFWVKQRKQNQL